MGNSFYSQTATKNVENKFACNNAGFVDMVNKIVEIAIFPITMISATIKWALSPFPDLKKSWGYAYDFLTNMGSFAGYLMAALYYFSLEAGLGEYSCMFSGLLYQLVYYAHIGVTLGGAADTDPA